MGKKKSTGITSLDIEEKLKEDFGDSIFVSGDSVLEQEKKTISLGPKLDAVTYGGCNEGNVILISGKQKWGKSALCLNLIKNGQKVPTSTGLPRKGYWVDVESKLESKDLKYVEGLKTDGDHFIHICSSQDKILTAEDYLNIVEGLIKGKKESIIVIDSISQLCGLEEIDSSYDKRFMSNTSSMLARFLRRSIPALSVNRNILCCIAHVTANLSPYGSPLSESGGTKIKFAANLHLQAKKMEYWTSGEKNIGQKTKWSCIATSNGPPGRSDWSYIRYGIGICEFTEWAEFATDYGFVKKSGAWLKVNFGDKEKGDEINVQGLDGVAQLLRDNPQYLEIIKQQVKESLYVV